MKNLWVVVLASITAFSLPITQANAAEASANVAITSNYVFRGQTQSDDSAALQGGYDIKQAKNDLGWYAGVFASTVTKGIELDIYGGWKGAFSNKSNMGYDVGGKFYKYTDSNFSGDVTELYAGVNYKTIYAKLYMGNGSGTSSYNYLDIGASFVVMTDMGLDVHFGRYLSSPSFNDVSANLNTSFKGFDVGLGLTYEDAAPTNEFEFFVTVAKKFDL